MIEYMPAEEAVNPLEDLPFVAYFSMSRYIESQIPIQLRPPSYIRKGKEELEPYEVGFCICVLTIGFCIGVIYGAIVA